MKDQQIIHKILSIAKNSMTKLSFLIFFGLGIIIGALLFTTTFNVGNISNIYLNVSDLGGGMNTSTTTNTNTSYIPPPPPPKTLLLSPPPLPTLNETFVAPPQPRLILLHNMDDEELGRKVSIMHKTNVNNTKNTTVSRKIAFMFLVRGALPLAPLWDKFFRGHEGMYNIYVHASPTSNHTYYPDSVFHGRRIPSKRVDWGKMNMVEAERRLLANALLDPTNQRFVLLSETCIPLFNFTTVYSYLINSKKSYIESYDDKGSTGRGRYNLYMYPMIHLSQWRKGSQWFEMNRELAQSIISDRKYIQVFREYCKYNCYGDEHYLPTYVNIKHKRRNNKRSVTWVDWSILGPHPGKFERPRVTIEFLNKLRSGYSCDYNGVKSNTCYMFARKFMPSSLSRLLMWSPKVLKFG